jgi:hypothetical protein
VSLDLCPIEYCHRGTHTHPRITGSIKGIVAGAAMTMSQQSHDGACISFFISFNNEGGSKFLTDLCIIVHSIIPGIDYIIAGKFKHMALSLHILYGTLSYTIV